MRIRAAMSAIGTKRTLRSAPGMFAFGGRVDMANLPALKILSERIASAAACFFGRWQGAGSRACGPPVPCCQGAVRVEPRKASIRPTI